MLWGESVCRDVPYRGIGSRTIWRPQDEQMQRQGQREGEIAMIDMKTKVYTDVQPAESHDMDYPYGLRITICDEKLEALGLEGIKVGEKVKIYAEAECAGVSMNEYDDKTEKRCELQIQQLEVKTGKEEEGEDSFFSSRS